MLLIVLALFWVALLAPIVVRRLRDGGTEKSILSFHTEHEVLSRQDYSVMPAHRLDQPDQSDRGYAAADRRPRLTVVHADDTFGTLESRSSWDEWSEDYDYEDARRAAPSPNRYAQAYSARPAEPVATATYHEPLRRRTMRSQRRMMFSRLVLVAVLLTAIAFFTGYPLLFDAAALSLFAVVLYIGLAFYAVSQGLLSDSALPIRVPERRHLATIEPLYRESRERFVELAQDDYDSEFYDESADVQWTHQTQRRTAFG